MLLFQVLSLPSNFTYNPPGSKRSPDYQSSTQARRQTLHSQQPICLSHWDDIKIIDESVSDIYNIRETSTYDITAKNLDDANYAHDKLVKKHSDIEDRHSLKNIIATSSDASLLLNVPMEHKPVHKSYGSTKHLFVRSKQIDITEETPFLNQEESESSTEVSKTHKPDSQENVQRIISERRLLDESLKDINQFDIFDVAHSSEENLVDTHLSEKEDDETKDEC